MLLRIISAGFLLLLPSYAVIASANTWTPLSTLPAPFNGAAARLDAESANPRTMIDAQPLRGRWLRVEAYVATRGATLGLALTAYDNKRRLVRSPLSTCVKQTDSRSRCSTSLWVPDEATSVLAVLFQDLGPVSFEGVSIAVADTVPASEVNRMRVAKLIDELRENYFRSADTDWQPIMKNIERAIDAPTGVDPLPMVFNLIREALPEHQHVGTYRTTDVQSGIATTKTAVPTCKPVAERVALLNMPTAFGLSEAQLARYAESAQRCLTSEPVSTRWVIDLRGNAGGEASFLLAALAPLFAPGPLIRYVNGAGKTYAVTLTSDAVMVGDRKAVSLSPSAKVATRRNAEVIAWIGEGCASACEALAIALSDRPHTRMFGVPTAGLATANESIALNDDIAGYFTAGWMAHSNGRRSPSKIAPTTEFGGEDLTDLLAKVGW